MVQVGSILGSHLLQVEFVVVMVHVSLVFFVLIIEILQMLVLLAVTLYMREVF